MAAAIHPKAEEANGVIAQAQGYFPALALPTSKQSSTAHQPDTAGMGELLFDGSFEPVLLVRPGLGGEEDTATSDASTEAKGLWLEEVE